MEDLFRSYWWLLFPLGYFIFAGWNSFMRYKQTQARIDLAKTYAAAGKEPPADLMASIDKDENPDRDWDDRSPGGRHRSGGGTAFLVFLFAGLAGVFGYVGYSGMLGGDEEFYFIAMILGVLSLAFLANGVFRGGRKGD